MYCESITLEQLRVFATVVEEGSFSAAGKKLGRAQSAVSYSISNLEEFLDIELFDRSFRKPRLTENGHKMLIHAKKVVKQMISLQEEAQKIVSLEETDIFIAVDFVFPPQILAEMCAKFKKIFPRIRLHLRTVLFQEVSDLVLSGKFDLGIFVPLGDEHPSLVQKSIYPLNILTVASKNHPLSQLKRQLQREDVEKYLQIVVSSSPGQELKKAFNIVGQEIWRVANFVTKKELFLAGVGWGGMPDYLVKKDIETGALVELDIDPTLFPRITGDLLLIRQQHMILGKGGRWIWDYLAELKNHLDEKRRSS